LNYSSSISSTTSSKKGQEGEEGDTKKVVVNKMNAVMPMSSYSSSDDEGACQTTINNQQQQDDENVFRQATLDDNEDDNESFYDAIEQNLLNNNNYHQSESKIKNLSSFSSIEMGNLDKTVIDNEASSKIDDNSKKEEEIKQEIEEKKPSNYVAELDDDEDEEDDLDLSNQTSVVRHLISQIRIGMDLTKITLPTFILERRSLLEMYADFFAHTNLFLEIPEIKNPCERMIQVVKWYMSTFQAGRKTTVAKKPYNPILGETFQCWYNIPTLNDTTTVEDGPVSWATRDNLTFIAEQVSHHPPITAFYAEHYNKRIQLDGYTWTKSKYLGLSIGVEMIGKAVLSLLDLDEEYVMTFPSAYGRSILTVPWVEIGGHVTITCAKTGYSAAVDFLTKVKVDYFHFK
jgi:hypothetical protein